MESISIKDHPPWYARGTPVVNPRDGPAAAMCGKPAYEIKWRKSMPGAFISPSAVPNIGFVRPHDLIKLYGYQPPSPHRQSPPARGTPPGNPPTLSFPPEQVFRAGRRAWLILGTADGAVGAVGAVNACPDLSGSGKAAADFSRFDAVKSKDVDRSGKAAADLSAFGEPDNVTKWIRDFDADRPKDVDRASRTEFGTSCPDVSGSGEAAADLSACEAPDNVEMDKDKVCSDLPESGEAAPNLNSCFDAVNVCPDLSGSKDVDRSGEAAADLISCYDAVKSKDVDRSREAAADLSAFGEPDNVTKWIRDFDADRPKDVDRASRTEFGTSCPGISGSGEAAAVSRFDAVNACPDLSGSKDVDRSGEAAADLSACEAPDNVEMDKDVDPSRFSGSVKFDAVNAYPDLSGSKDVDRSGEAAADLSAFGEPDNVTIDMVRPNLSESGEAAADFSCFDAVNACPGLSGSKDVDRPCPGVSGSGEAAAVSRFDAVKSKDVDRSREAAADLSACEAPDNVTMDMVRPNS